MGTWPLPSIWVLTWAICPKDGPRGVNMSATHKYTETDQAAITQLDKLHPVPNSPNLHAR